MLVQDSAIETEAEWKRDAEVMEVDWTESESFRVWLRLARHEESNGILEPLKNAKDAEPVA